MNKSEEKRQKELQAYLDTNIQQELQGLTELACNICDTPISLVNILDDEHQITKASTGWDIKQMPIEDSFCQYTILDDDIMIVEDARKDERFQDSPFVEDSPNIRFYAGMPLHTQEGHKVGAMCIIDHKPRQLTPSQKESLKVLADEVVARFELARNQQQLEKRNSKLKKFKIFLENSSDTRGIIDPDTLHFLDINEKATRLLGGSKEDYLDRPFGKRITDAEARDQIMNFLNQREELEATFTAPVKAESGDILYLEHTFSLRNDRWFMTARDITKKAKAQQELRDHSDAIEASMDGIAILDQENNFIFVNEAHAAIFGYRRDELMGERWEMLYGHDERKRFKNTIYTILEDTRQWRGEAEGIMKNGDSLPLEISLSKRENDSTVCIVRDISQRRQTQKKLKQTLTNLAIGQELAEVGSWTWNLKNDTLRWSEKVYDICGIENISLEPSLDLFEKFVHPDDLEKLRDIIEQIRAGEEVGKYKHRLLMPDGKIKWVQHSGSTTFDSQGRPVKVNGAIQDITKQKQAQLKLKREKELSDRIINSLPISFFMFDMDGNAIRWNDKLRELTGYNEQEISYMHPTDFFPEEQRQRIKRAIAKVDDKGEATIEAELQDENGKRVTHLFSARLFKGDSKKYFLGTGLDISDLKQYEQQLKQSLEEKEVLLSEIHHRVKNNLAIISGLLKLESFNTTDKQTKNILQNSQMRIQSMAEVHEMLYEAESFNNLAFKDFVGRIIESIRDVYQRPEADVTFNQDIKDVQLNVNQAIPCSLIINETVTNAYKHAFEQHEEGQIDIKLSQQDQQIHLSVTDNGIGLPEDVSLEESDSLGFTLIKTLKRQLDGQIEIESENGTAIHLTFEKRAIKGTGSSLSLQ